MGDTLYQPGDPFDAEFETTIPGSGWRDPKDRTTNDDVLDVDWSANTEKYHVNLRQRQEQQPPKKRMVKWTLSEVAVILKEFHKLYEVEPCKSYVWNDFNVLADRIRQYQPDYGRSASSVVHKLQKIAESLHDDTVDKRYLYLVDLHTSRYYLCAAFNLKIHPELDNEGILPVKRKRTRDQVLPSPDDEPEPYSRSEVPSAYSEVTVRAAGVTSSELQAVLRCQEMKAALVSSKATMLQALLSIYQAKGLLPVKSIERASMESSAQLLLDRMIEIEKLM